MSKRLIAAFSGGKDSTAMVLRMSELGWDFEMFCTPTGDELPEVKAHVDDVVAKTGKKIHYLPGRSIYQLIEQFKALPNHRMRWCTRMLKIEPCLAFFQEHANDAVLCVGLRADEEARAGIFSNDIETRFPLREWGWDLGDVIDYCRVHAPGVPRRTDCGMCYAQRLSEWYRLWRDHPERYANYESWEAKVTAWRTKPGEDPKWYTLRSASRDTWPAALKDLRKEFESGRIPRGGSDDQQLTMFEDDYYDTAAACRVCTL